jgi:hypothetical protein
MLKPASFCLIFICFNANNTSPANHDSALVIESALNKQSSENEKYQLKIEELPEDSYGTPTNKISLVADGKEYFIEEVKATCSEIPRSEFGDEIPKEALVAYSTWWAGSGSRTYVIKQKNKFIVYVKFLDEGMEDEPIWEVLVKIKI